ncbi:MAG: hypothetical protein KAS72_15270 [Phycisphaerales bacterium]|nr:hypothetical protein [Phycisphaerales bacterium]
MLTNETFSVIVQAFWEFLWSRTIGFVILGVWVWWAWWLRRRFRARLDEGALGSPGPLQFVARSCARWIQYCEGIALVTGVSAIVLFIMYATQRLMEKSFESGETDMVPQLPIIGTTVGLSHMLIGAQIVLFAALSIYKFRSFWIAQCVYRDMRKSEIDCISPAGH